MNPKISNLILIVVVILVVSVIAEITTRIIIDPPPTSEGGWYVESRNPILSYGLTPNKSGIFQGHDAHVNNDERRDDHDRDSVLNKTLIAFVGDSFVFGQGVNQGDTLPNQFEDLYNAQNDNKIAALNFGIGGYNLEQEVGLINERILKYPVSKVFVIYYINDIEPKLTFGGERKEIKIPISLQIYNNILKYSRFANFLKFRLSNIFYKIGLANQEYVNYFNGLYADNSSSWINFQKNLSRLSSIQDDNDIEIYYVIYPAMSHFNKKHPYIPIYEKVLNEAEKNGLKTVNLLDVFAGKDATKLRTNIYDNHPNKEAQAIAAKYLISQTM